jgi:uncharacterized protein YjbI with pentapeptide repeats
MSHEIKIEKKASEVIQPVDDLEAREAIQDRQDLSGASLRGMILKNLSAVGAILRKTDLANADLSHSLLIQPNFYKASLEDAAVNNTILLGGDLVKARFVETDLSESALIGVNAEDGSFERANLRNAVFVSSKLVNADFREANLAHARLASLDVTNADFTDADLTGARAYHVNWDQAKVPPTLMPEPLVKLSNRAKSILLGGLIGGLALMIYAMIRKRKQPSK